MPSHAQAVGDVPVPQERLHLVPPGGYEAASKRANGSLSGADLLPHRVKEAEPEAAAGVLVKP